MRLKTIVVFIDISPNSQARIDYAVKIAHRHDAHLTGIYIAPTHWGASPSESFAIGSEAITAVTKFHRDQEHETSKKAMEIFNTAIDNEKISAKFHIIKDSDADQRLRPILLYADLIIAGNPGTNGLPKNWSAETILLAIGVPFLLVPNGWQCQSGEIGARILLGWNGSRESRRAITDSMPFMIEAQAVSVVEVDPGKSAPHGDSLDTDLLLYISRHGVKVTLDSLLSQGRSIATVIMEYAEEHNIDFIVLGAYSHSRSSEIIFGGVTRSILKSMSVPLLIVH
ncbi:universal stress protein [Acerihabitans arboris]|uniref:Universal stress protein n=1 Tax=Acerihabitans arboris TaxID=2691583 RepID=A0A845SYC0_9GAMM|nr:universal stress protein [Acerihabitans arboris]NDL65835.1 universal stress protein [Acerihabitans arboris]